MGRISNYKSSVPKVILTDIPGFDGGESITCRQDVPFSIVQFFLDHQDSLRVDAGQQEIETTIDAYNELVSVFCSDIIEEWSFLDDDDQPLPVAAETLKRLDIRDVMAIIGLYLQAALSPLAGSQATGAPSPGLPSNTASDPA